MSRIEWTGVTWNPVTGCDKVSPGCDHCYALRLAGHLKAMGQARYQRDGDPRTSGPGFAVTCHPEALALPLRWRRPRLVFVNSMSDLFHPRVSDGFIGSVFDVMAATPRHTYQVLTKRPKRMRALLHTWQAAGWTWRRHDMHWCGPLPGPLPNVWLGTSIETASYLWRAGELRATPAAVRFISAEPLLGELAGLDLAGIGWVIAGGESGPGHRPVDLDWIRGLRDRCQAAGVAFFYKQQGGPTPKAGGRVLDGRTWDQMPATTPARPAPPVPPRGRAMPSKSHAQDPADPCRCTCGYAYPSQCRGGHPILPAATHEAITSKAAAGVPFSRIARETGHSLHVVRRVVHG